MRRRPDFAILFVTFFLIGACGGSGGPAGAGSKKDAAGDGAAGDQAAGDSAPPTDTPGNDTPMAAGDAAGDASDVPIAPTDTGRDQVSPAPDAPADTPPDAGVDRVSMPCKAPGSCDPFDPAACGAQRCEPQLDGNYSCAATKGVGTAGTACTSRTECAGGLDCVRIGDDAATTCQRMCPRGSLGFCGGELRCTDFIVGCVQYCRQRPRPCDIYAQNCPDAADACTLATDSETRELYTGCRKAGTVMRGQPCDGNATCAKGLICIRVGVVQTCRQVCTADGGAVPCQAAGETCSGLSSSARVTYCQ